MSRVGQRRTVERGIYKDATGYEVVGRAGKKTRSRRYDLDTPIATMRAWRDGTAADLRDDHQPTADAKSLTTRIDRYITKSGIPKDHAYRPSLNAWKTEYGHLEARQLTPALASQALERWKHAGYSPQSLYYRRLVIEKVWKLLDGPRVKTPVDDLHVSRPRGRRPVWVSDETILSVLMNLRRSEMAGQLRDAKTRARFLVLVTTGQRPAQLKRAERGDVNLSENVWQVRPAKGGEPIPLYLNSEMRDAWTAFHTAGAWGWYDTRSFARTIHHAGWPKGIRPYNARHATGLTLSARGADLGDIQTHMGHTSMTTTRQYYVPGLEDRMRAVSETLEGRFRGRSVAPERGTSKNRLKMVGMAGFEPAAP